MILKRNSSRPICEAIFNVFGRPKKCIFLNKSDGWNKCYIYGFRNDSSGAKGVAKQTGLIITSYDNSMLNHKKNFKFNFCIYRVISPIILLIGLLGIKEIYGIIKAIINTIST